MCNSGGWLLRKKEIPDKQQNIAIICIYIKLFLTPKLLFLCKSVTSV